MKFKIKREKKYVAFISVHKCLASYRKHKIKRRLIASLIGVYLIVAIFL